MKLEQHQLIELHETLTRRFNEGELRTLCFSLKVDYDDLPGEGKLDKARELVGRFDRRNQLPKLVAAIQKYRPDINFEETQQLVTNSQNLLPTQLHITMKWKDYLWDRRSNLFKGVTITSAVTFILALIGLAADLAGLGLPIPTFSTDISYQVRVQSTLNGESIENAKVTIEVGGNIAPIESFTDSEGVAILVINKSRTGKLGRLAVEANGYEDYERHINLTENQLPVVIMLESIP